MQCLHLPPHSYPSLSHNLLHNYLSTPAVGKLPVLSTPQIQPDTPILIPDPSSQHLDQVRNYDHYFSYDEKTLWLISFISFDVQLSGNSIWLTFKIVMTLPVAQSIIIRLQSLTPHNIRNSNVHPFISILFSLSLTLNISDHPPACLGPDSYKAAPRDPNRFAQDNALILQAEEAFNRGHHERVLDILSSHFFDKSHHEQLQHLWLSAVYERGNDDDRNKD